MTADDSKSKPQEQGKKVRFGEEEQSEETRAQSTDEPAHPRGDERRLTDEIREKENMKAKEDLEAKKQQSTKMFEEEEEQLEEHEGQGAESNNVRSREKKARRA